MLFPRANGPKALLQQRCGQAFAPRPHGAASSGAAYLDRREPHVQAHMKRSRGRQPRTAPPERTIPKNWPWRAWKTWG